jgi:hypothetical protein
MPINAYSLLDATRSAERRTAMPAYLKHAPICVLTTA